jgi:hypothetical protein
MRLEESPNSVGGGGTYLVRSMVALGLGGGGLLLGCHCDGLGGLWFKRVLLVGESVLKYWNGWIEQSINDYVIFASSCRERICVDEVKEWEEGSVGTRRQNVDVFIY